jgi:hypothetical protein
MTQAQPYHKPASQQERDVALADRCATSMREYVASRMRVIDWDDPAPVDLTLIKPSRSKPKPAARKRKPSIDRLIAQAEKSGKRVTSATLPDGTKLTFDELEPIEATNPWLAKLEKATTQ